MNKTILALFIMIVVGFFAIAEGRDASGTRQQKEAHQQNEGCQLIPNGDLSQQKSKESKEQDGSIMKGLVF